MEHDGGGTPQDLVIQTWTMYSIAMVIFLLRLYARYIRLGFKWQIEDYLMVLAVGWYTTFAVTNIAIIQGGGSSLYMPGQFATFSPQDILDRIKGSKIELASEMCMLNTMYTLKACMLFIYFQLTSNLKQHKLVKACAAYTFCGWLATVLVLFLNCHPFSGYWTLPPPQEECATYFRYEVTQCVFNISSDLAMFSIILPMLFKLQMKWKTKVPILFIFSMGLVVVICACTSKYFTFRDIWDTSYQFWYLREASIGMYVTNIPYVWSLARQSFRFLRSDAVASFESDAFESGDRFASGRRSRTGACEPRNRLYSLDSIGEVATRAGKTESEEHIIALKAGLGTVGPDDYAKDPNGETVSWAQSEGRTKSSEGLQGNFIKKTTDVVIQSEEKC